MKNDLLALGLDFGTASVRALLVDLKGNERGSSVVKYRHGQITETLPGGKNRCLLILPCSILAIGWRVRPGPCGVPWSSPEARPGK